MPTNDDPASGWQVEVIYHADAPDVESHAMPDEDVTFPQGGLLVATTHENGLFAFGIPTACFWGFAALGVGLQYRAGDSAFLSKDAIMWVQDVDVD